MNFSVSSSRTNASTHAKKYSDPKQPSRENVQRKSKRKLKEAESFLGDALNSCWSLLMVSDRWWRLRSPKRVSSSSHRSQLILLIFLILQSTNQNKTENRKRKIIELHKTWPLDCCCCCDSVGSRNIFVGDDDEGDNQAMTSMSPHGLAHDVCSCFLYNQCYLVSKDISGSFCCV